MIIIKPHFEGKWGEVLSGEKCGPPAAKEKQMIFDFRNNIYETDKWNFQSEYYIHSRHDVKEANEELNGINEMPYEVYPENILYSQSVFFKTEDDARVYMENENKADDRVKLNIRLRDKTRVEKILEESEDTYAILTLYIAEDTFQIKFFNTRKRNDIETVKRNLHAAIRSDNKVFCWTGDYEEM